MPDSCILLSTLLCGDLLHIHAAAGYKNNACADHEQSTNNVEDGCADATGGRKLNT